MHILSDVYVYILFKKYHVLFTTRGLITFALQNNA